MFSQLGDVLNYKFKSTLGLGLSEDNLKFLAEKAFRNLNLEDWKNQRLSWSLFNNPKDPLPGRDFTFWEWVYALLIFLREEQLRALWCEGYVMGFVWRRQAEELLLNSPIGTFLLRFSDSELGAITVAGVGQGLGGVAETFML